MSRGVPSPILALLLLTSASCCAASPLSGNSDCGVYGWPVPAPPSGGKLLQVNAVTRHGDRTPWTGDYCWPKDSSVWDCYLDSAEIPMYSDDQYGCIIPRVYRKVFQFGDEALKGNCSVGQLTTIGFYQHLMNGYSLRKAYVNSGFLSKNLSRSEVYIRSDNVPRTQQSAESLMLGMFPPNGSYTEVVELHTMDTTFDDITANPQLCPKFKEYEMEFQNSSVWKNHQNVTNAVLNAISKAINFTVGEKDLDHFADCLRTHHCHNLSWPQGMTDALYNMTWVEFSWQVFNLYKYPSVSANAQVGIGFLLKDIWRNINSSVQGKDVQKFLLYSGHDTTLLPILVALQVDTMQWPPYASMMLLELYDISGEHYMRIIYNGEVLELPFCGSKTLCSYAAFSSYMQSVTPSDPAQQCKATTKWKWY